MTDKNNNETRNTKLIDTIIKVVLGAVASILILAFTSLEKSKLDKNVFTIYKEFNTTQISEIKTTLNTMNKKIDTLIERSAKQTKYSKEENHNDTL